MENKLFAEKFLKSVVEQNEKELPSFFNEDAEILWPDTSEKFTVAAYIIANCKYPGDWQGEVKRINTFNDWMVVVSKVYSVDVAFYVTSFIDMREGKIQKLEEYWSEIGEAPEWRQNLNLESGNE